MKTSLWCHRLTLWSFSFRTQCGMIERAWIMEPVRPGFKSFTKELIALCYAFLHAKSLQSCPSLCDPMDCTPPAPLSTGFCHALLQGISLNPIC